MAKSIFKTVIAVIAAGTLIYFAGFFLLKLVLSLFVIAAVLRFFIKRRLRKTFSGFHHATIIHIRRKDDGNIINI